MNGHVTQWLGAYHDGELKGVTQRNAHRSKRHIVERRHCSTDGKGEHAYTADRQENSFLKSGESGERGAPDKLLRKPCDNNNDHYNRGRLDIVLRAVLQRHGDPNVL